MLNVSSAEIALCKSSSPNLSKKVCCRKMTFIVYKTQHPATTFADVAFLGRDTGKTDEVLSG